MSLTIWNQGEGRFLQKRINNGCKCPTVREETEVEIWVDVTTTQPSNTQQIQTELLLEMKENHRQDLKHAAHIT